jgi:predicted nucleic acid-binding Zn ribbon protein
VTTATNKRKAAVMSRKPLPGGIRKEILREWRGYEETADLNQGVHAAEKFISAILSAVGAEDGLHEDQVRSAWKELAGDFISRHTEPVSVKNGHLVLRVTQPAMRFHLEQMKPMLLTRIRAQLGETRIKSVKFALG